MTDQQTDSAYIAALWEQPRLCLAIFGVQFITDAGHRLYDESGIEPEIFAALEAAAAGAGLLHARPLMSPEGPLLLQYWRSYADLDRWARQRGWRHDRPPSHGGQTDGVVMRLGYAAEEPSHGAFERVPPRGKPAARARSARRLPVTVTYSPSLKLPGDTAAPRLSTRAATEGCAT